MNRKIKIAIIGILVIVIGYYPFIILTAIVKDKIYGHSDNQIIYKKYLWIFKDFAKTDLDSNFCFSYVKERDVYNHFIYKRHYMITLWEFKDLSLLSLKNTPINLNVKLDDVRFSSREKLNVYANPIEIKYGFSFKDKMEVNLDANSSIIKNIESANYKGFYGSMNRMTFSNEKNENCILFEYPKGKTPIIFLLYKTSNGFYVITIESNDNIFDENIINILNLK